MGPKFWYNTKLHLFLVCCFGVLTVGGGGFLINWKTKENTNAITSTDLKISNIQCDNGICTLVGVPLSYKVHNLTYNSYINKTFDNSCQATDYIAFYQNSSRVYELHYCKDDYTNWEIDDSPSCSSDILWNLILIVVVIMFGIALGFAILAVKDLSARRIDQDRVSGAVSRTSQKRSGNPAGSTINLAEKTADQVPREELSNLAEKVYLNPASHISYGLSDFID